MPRNPVVSQSAPKAIGPYSQAVWAGKKLLYCSGQIPTQRGEDKLIEGGIGEHTTQCLRNLEAVCAEAALNCFSSFSAAAVSPCARRHPARTK